MKHFIALLLPFCFAASSFVLSAQTMSDRDATHRPMPMYSKMEKKRLAKTRIVQGVVKDEQENPVKGALVNLKNLKTNQTITFVTKADGRYLFEELKRDEDYQLSASAAGKTTPIKKLSHYDPQTTVTRMLIFGEPEESANAAK